MIKLERQNEIEKIVRNREYISIFELPKLLNCSEATVRRDIEEMELRGLLKRNQGIVIWSKKNVTSYSPQQLDINYQYRRSQNVDSKRILGEYASKFVNDNDILYLDTGTTMLEIAKNIPDIPLTVVTNDLFIALELEDRYQIQVIILGGTIRRGTHTVAGSVATEMMSNFHFQKAFLSPAGIDIDGEFMFFNLQAMEVRQKAFSIADKRVMVADSSKFGKKAFVKGFGFDACDLLITDKFPENSDIDWETVCGKSIPDIRTCE